MFKIRKQSLKLNPKDSDDDVQHSELLAFWTLFIVRNSTYKKTQRRTETDPVSEMLCFLVFRIPEDGESPEPQ
jgi:hypothetical protein